MQIKLVNAALNMVVSTALGEDTFSPKANKFFIAGGHTNLGSSLCAIRGYYYSIRPGMGKILLNCRRISILTWFFANNPHQ